MSKKIPNISSVLDKLWSGDLYPEEQFLYPSSQYHEHLHAMAESSRMLEDTLDDEQKKLLEKHNTCHYDFAAYAEAELFKYAFRLGARMMLEVLSEEAETAEVVAN